MDDKQQLGSKIVLSHFSVIEPAKMAIIRKMVGNYVKKISAKHKFDHLELLLDKNNSHPFTISGTLCVDAKVRTAQYSGDNFFLCLGEVLNKLETKL